MEFGTVVGAVVRGINLYRCSDFVVNGTAKNLDGHCYRESAGGHFGWSSVENAGELVKFAAVVADKDRVRVGTGKNVVWRRVGVIGRAIEGYRKQTGARTGFASN